MKRLILLFTSMISLAGFATNLTISGRVTDENNQPISFVNIYIETCGTMTNDDGEFTFECFIKQSTFILNASAIGYESYKQEFTYQSDNLFVPITLKAFSTDLEEVVIKGSVQKIKGNGTWTNISPVEIANTGGSAGNLYRALQIMPGVQPQGETGKLIVHGGDSRETQTYIDDMHVLVPYTTTGRNVPARGRYSPFMFEGINFSSGVYSQEYGDGLSAVLPLFTKDESNLSKIGINPSTVGVAGGGTKTFDKGSVSVNLEYQNLAPYFKVVSDIAPADKPYRNGATATQLRFTPNEKTILKTYFSFDRTNFKQGIMNLEENNIYSNTTFRYVSEKGYKFFAGAAFSDMVQNVDGAIHENDKYREKAREIHLKVKTFKRLSNFLDLSAGVETFNRKFGNEYKDSITQYSPAAKLNMFSAFAIATFYPVRNMNVDVSARLEDGNLSPRISANYNLKGVDISVTAGRYIQQPETKYLFADAELKPEECTHYIAGLKYMRNGKIYRMEAYYKRYKNLPLQTSGYLSQNGYGYSKGLDLYFNDESLFKNLEYRLAYSLNWSKRKSDMNTEMVIPYYVSRHTVSLSLRYMLNPIKSMIGITNQYASGRPYSNGLTKPYNSLDMSISYLASPGLIVHASVSNIFGRKNVFSNASGAAVRPAYDRFIYIGVFISLGGKAAYDVSNF